MNTRERYARFHLILCQRFPNAKLELNYRNAFELFVALLLSARCSDKLVNQRTYELFTRFKTFQEIVEADQSDIKRYLKDITFADDKAVHLIKSAQIITERHNGEVPENVNMLLQLPGVGRKTANLLLSELYNIPSIAVDTHVSRVSKRLGLTKRETELMVEKDLMNIIPKDEWVVSTRQFMLWGRYICKFNNPDCERCPANSLCETIHPISVLPDTPMLPFA